MKFHEIDDSFVYFTFKVIFLDAPEADAPAPALDDDFGDLQVFNNFLQQKI